MYDAVLNVSSAQAKIYPEEPNLVHPSVDSIMRFINLEEKEGNIPSEVLKKALMLVNNYSVFFSDIELGDLKFNVWDRVINIDQQSIMDV